MKKDTIKQIINVAFLLLLLTPAGCEKVFEDALDRADDSRETLEGMLGDKDKVWGMLNSCYTGVPADRTEIRFHTTFESLDDNVFDAQGQSMGNWRSGLLSPSFAAISASRSSSNAYFSYNLKGGGGGYWARYWGAIRYCNTLIENIDHITVPLEELPQSDREMIRDEAIVLRAYFHTMLIGMYGPLPFMDSNVPLDWSGWEKMTRPTYDEVANKIAGELQAVIDRGIIPMKRDPVIENDKCRIPLGFAYGLKSRVLLWNASPLNNPTGDVVKYETAAAAARQFLDKNAYSLEPFEKTKQMYISRLTENLEATEVIWRAGYRQNQLCNIHGMDLSTADPKRCNFIPNKAGETPSQEIVDCYELKNGALIIENYDATHANPVFTPECISAGYDDVNNPYVNRDDRFYRDILFNGNYFGESYKLGSITVWTYLGAKGTGTNGNSTSGKSTATYTGYYYAKDRDPIWYGSGSAAQGNSRCHHHSIWMRYAEIYLNYAEALCGAGRLNEACEALDMTRLRAHQPSVKAVPGFQLNKAWLMKRIQNERRVELVLEDARFYDVRRWNLISDQNNNTVSGMLVEKVGNNQFKHTRYQIPFVWACHNEKYKILPIPIEDKKFLPNLDQPEAWQ